jgi:hypothetical protein
MDIMKLARPVRKIGGTDGMYGRVRARSKHRGVCHYSTAQRRHCQPSGPQLLKDGLGRLRTPGASRQVVFHRRFGRGRGRRARLRPSTHETRHRHGVREGI